MTSSDLNEKRNSDYMLGVREGIVFMLRNASDAKSGSDTVYKQVIVEIPRSGFLAYPVFGLMECELCILSEAFLLRASNKDMC